MSRLQNSGLLVGMLAIAFLWWARPLNAQTCPAEIEFTNPKPVPAKDGTLTLSLLSSVSKPASNCLSAEIRIQAAFFDAEENLICSGVIESIATQNNNVQSTTLELRPLNVVEFIRQKVLPIAPPKRLF